MINVLYFVGSKKEIYEIAREYKRMRKIVLKKYT
jgi:hypothetical protein